MDNDLNLSALRALRYVLREGSFSAAALALRLPKSTLSKRIADLESALNLRLIERNTRGLRPTREGEILAARAGRLLQESDDIRRALAETEGAPRGHLRLAVPQVIGNVMMGALAAQFRAAHPDVTLEIHFMDRPPDLLAEGFDGALRFGPLEDSGQVARQVLQGQAFLVANPNLPNLNRLMHPADLTQFPLVALASIWHNPLTLVSGAQSVTVAQGAALLLGSQLAVRDAVIAGAGISALPRIIALPEIAAGRLVHVLPDWATPMREMYFVYPSAHSVTARLRAFIDFIAAALQGRG